MTRYSPVSSRRAQWWPRSGSAIQCDSSRTSSSPRAGAFSTVQHTMGAWGSISSSPVDSPTVPGGSWVDSLA